ncbi:P-type DNA transfer protein VirB5 [Acinetobacter pittii]|uniref:P-type DNA transfer protein VirB5 n=1 Tax=Acinetobacter pittii TaxID=48296 RepID=A0A6H0G0B5_ACIPI|nr:P-type DNA transfer protein VirB5 [Acinetobacter pittii]QIT20024.1 P-type DNA transfer protein VirB5 [Acinetobacter pittii]
MKYKLKTIALTLAISFGSVSIVNVANAGIPVVDAGSIAQALIQVQQLTDQIKNQIAQINTMQNQLKATTGSRNLGELFNNPALRNYLPTDYANLYDAVKSGNAGKIGSAMQNLQKQEDAYNKGQGSGAQRKQTELLMQKAVNTQALEAQLGRLQNIEKLMSQINYATDAKAAADLQNRIAVETALTQAEGNRIALMSQLHQANMQLAEQQRVQQSKTRLLRGAGH